jgi:hypothetical protein
MLDHQFTCLFNYLNLHPKLHFNSIQCFLELVLSSTIYARSGLIPIGTPKTPSVQAKKNKKKKYQGNEDNSDRADVLYVQFILGTIFTEVVIIA